jgi:tetratricopeptide (TPR) repeat protein
VRLDYIQILRKRNKIALALEQAKYLHERNPEDPVFQSHLAIESMHNNDFERAFELFDRVLAKMPGDPATLVSRGHALKTFGRQDDAVASYRSAYKSMPEHGDAWFGLANLKTYRFTADEIETMRREEASERLGGQSRIQICFALGKALEDEEQFETSFDYYRRGNEMKRIQSRYDADQMTAELRAQITHCDATLFEKQQGQGHDAPDPIFIVGLPRAGSTLLEQILASHSQIDGTQELPNILALANRLRGRKKASDPSAYPENLHQLEGDQLRQFGEDYIASTRVHRGDAPFFIDKMPNNFRHVALIHLILPNAKIIDARREPMACCFSGFKQLFAEGQEFTYGLREIGQYYRDYVEVMKHWDGVLPGKVLRVHHEDVLDDLEQEVRRILEYCGLPFEAQCLEFYRTKRSVRTASSEQVRQPINKSGVDQWRPFEPFLEPLKTALGPAGLNWR